MFSHSLAAQQVKQFSFKHFSTREGLAFKSIRYPLQDADGFIWIAPSNGLQRYNDADHLPGVPDYT